MGVIRLLLALSVVLYHAGVPPQWSGTGATASVQAFYLISGFYIAMILRGPYKASIVKFWVNRALRLYPAYIVVALLTLVARLLFRSDLVDSFGQLPGNAQLLLIFSNIFVFGQDWIMFLGVQAHQLHVVRDFRNSTPELWKLLMDPPAWSLGIEISFYLIAPFLIKRSLLVLVSLMLLSISVRIGLAQFGLTADPWTYRFFPCEIALFLTGAMVWILKERFPEGWIALSKWGSLVFVLLIGAIVFFPVIPAGTVVKYVGCYLLLAIGIPIVFDRTKSSRTDRYIGDISYLLYISHWTPVHALQHLLNPQFPIFGAISITICTLVIAGVLGALVEWPLRPIRANLRASAEKESSLHVSIVDVGAP